MTRLKAIIFDVDGTLANTERDGHRVAFNLAFQELNLDWHWDVGLYGELLAVTGGKERIKYHIDRAKLDIPSVDDFCKTVHQLKTKHYLELLKSGKISLRNGVKLLLEEAKHQNLILAIATTTTPQNVSVLLENQLGKSAINWFKVIGAGDIVPHKKPAPDIYNFVLNELELKASECVAIEDSHNGLVSAKTAGLATIVTTNNYTELEDFTAADLVINQFGDASQPFTTIKGDNYNHSFLSVSLLQKICDSR